VERILDEFPSGDKARPKEAAPMKKSKKNLKKSKRLSASKSPRLFNPVDG